MAAPIALTEPQTSLVMILAIHQVNHVATPQSNSVLKMENLSAEMSAARIHQNLSVILLMLASTTSHVAQLIPTSTSVKERTMVKPISAKISKQLMMRTPLLAVTMKLDSHSAQSPTLAPKLKIAATKKPERNGVIPPTDVLKQPLKTFVNAMKKD